jgi:hypothetical protein
MHGVRPSYGLWRRFTQAKETHLPGADKIRHCRVAFFVGRL